ncbi:Alpha/Beta hydrolase protein [Rhodocollybia butyracea]|uniref:Alpha/Beta hydrolase protein n=1 Tax=Rhodocollybia butyracea TaxID=206335 RepID=A0A9P5TWJ0_9AGAR|nr:Alpha/Beta hydrolase protein [Rhodocollybia butyracea]
MDDGNFHSTTSLRGHIYSYYFVRQSLSKPTILFLHGFPSTSRDWASQVTFFSAKGYSILAPDLLGYGKTSAPSDIFEYKMLDMAQDIVDILEALKVEKVIGVGHDWGSFLLSRLLNTHVHRFLGAAFLAVGYIPPQPLFDYEAQISTMVKLVGYEVFGYWEFFAADDAPKLCEDNIESFYSLLFPKDPMVWKTDLAPRGKSREWIERNKQGPRAGFWTDSERENHKINLLQRGLQGPLNWYRGRLTGMNNEDESKIPVESYSIGIPTFFGGALRDHIALAAGGKAMMARFCPELTVRDFDTSHWIMLEVSAELNDALSEFFVSLQGSTIG